MLNSLGIIKCGTVRIPLQNHANENMRMSDSCRAATATWLQFVFAGNGKKIIS